MGQRIGRPTNNPRTIQTRIRMTTHEADMLDECAKLLGTTKTDVIVKGIQVIYDMLPQARHAFLRTDRDVGMS